MSILLFLILPKIQLIARAFAMVTVLKGWLFSSVVSSTPSLHWILPKRWRKLSGIKTRLPIYYAAGFLVLLGLLPKFGALAQIIPSPVLGGAMPRHVWFCIDSRDADPCVLILNTMRTIS